MCPVISAIVATYNAPDLLYKTLVSLRDQSLKSNVYEVIIIDDGSTDHTLDMLKEFCTLHTHFQWYTQKNQGPAVARNLGIRHARGKYIAITDHDCIADRDWLRAVCDIFDQDQEVLGIEGLTASNPEAIHLFTHQVVNFSGGMFATCNVAYRTDILNQIGGFDEDYPYGHEDTDLSLRVRQLGSIRFSPEAKIIHPPIPISFEKLVKQANQMVLNEFILFKKQPNWYNQYHRSPLHTLLVELCFKMFFHLLRINLKYVYRSPVMYVKYCLAIFLQRMYLLYLLAKMYWKNQIPVYIAE